MKYVAKPGENYAVWELSLRALRFKCYNNNVFKNYSLLKHLKKVATDFVNLLRLANYIIFYDNLIYYHFITSRAIGDADEVAGVS